METLDSLQLNTDIPGVILADTELPQTLIPDLTLFSTPGGFSVPLEVDLAPLEVETNGEQLFQEMIPDTAIDSLTGDAIASFQNTGTGLTGQYFDTLDFVNPIFTRTDATIDFDWGLGSPHSAIEADSFSVRWTGKVQPLYTETYRFHTLSDDGVRLWVNGELLIDQWVHQDTTEHSGTISLEAGQFYDIQLEYYERNSNAVSKLSWSSDSQTKEVIPTSQLYSIVQFPQPVPGDSEVLELEVIADSFYNPGEPVTVTGILSGEEISNLSTLDFSLQQDGGAWIDIIDAIELTFNPDDPSSVFFNYQLSDLEPSHYQLRADAIDYNGNSQEVLNHEFTILSLDSGDVEGQGELSDRVLQAIASATNLDNYTPEQLAATREWVVSIKNGASSEELANDFEAENLGETGYIPNTYFWEFPTEMNPHDIASRLGDEVNIEFAYPLVPLNIEFFSPANEPNFDAQWYLQNADIPQVWDNYQGEGVIVGVVDDGFDVTNPDLASNYLADLSFDFDQNDGDPSQALEFDFLQDSPVLLFPESEKRSRINVSHVSGVLSNVVVTLDVADVDIEDLEVSLISPGGTEEELRFTENGDGTFSSATDAFNGEKPNTHAIERNYNWRLDIENEGGEQGILKNWLLTLETSNPHGTAVAGIVAAKGDNQLLGTGVAPSANWVGLRLGADGFSGKKIADALSHQNQEIDIYNNSWGQGFFNVIPPLALYAFEEGVEKGRDSLGSIFVFAAGNDGHNGDNVNYNGFANSRQTIAVAAIDRTGAQTFYSNPGAPVLVSAYANNVHSFALEPEGETNFDFETGFPDFDDSYLREIEDGDNFSSTLEVNDVGGEITQVEVNLDITHQDYQDLQVILVSPSGTEVELFANTPFTQSDYLNRELSEDVLGVNPSISLSSSAPRQLPETRPTLFLGTFQPSGDLNTFLGENPNGDWQLKVTDTANGNSSDNQLNRWSLNISTSGIVTTDIEGAAGYSGSGETVNFGGTSAAAPLVSGVVALMLEANPNLSWRDVQEIIIETADRNDPLDEDWTTNGAGYEINHKYGFGAINAENAVQLAEDWYNLDKSLGKEESIESGPIPVWRFIPDYNESNPRSVRSTVDFEELGIEDTLTVESVEVDFKAFHSYRGDLEVVLVHSYEDPETGEMKATESVLAELRNDDERKYDWTFTTARHWGEPSTGEWTLEVTDLWEEDIGVFQGWKLNLFGNKPNVEISATDTDASESGDLAEFAITLNEVLAEDLRVYYTIEGTAINGVDYVEGNGNSPLSDSVVIPVGTTEVMIPIEAVDDDEVEGNESVILRLLADVAYSVGDEGLATVNIADNEEVSLPDKLLAPDGAEGDQFGLAIATNENYTLIGSHRDDDNYKDSGSAYLFDMATGEMVQKFIAPDGARGHYFGWSVALNEDYALIGSRYDNQRSGSAYLFDIATGEMVQKFVAPDAANNDQFGYSVALDENYALIGSYHASNGEHTDSGAAYLFDITTGEFVQKFQAHDPEYLDHFGSAVAVEGDYVVISSPNDNTEKGGDSGSAYLFNITTGDLVQKFLPPDADRGDFLGNSVDIDGNYALISSRFEDNENGLNSGSVYLLDITTGDVVQEIISPGGPEKFRFGESVALNGNLALISALVEDREGNSSGIAHLFDISSSTFVAEFVASDSGGSRTFGASVALNDNYAVIGSNGDGSNGYLSGSAYVFDISEFSPPEPAELFPYSQKVLAPDAASGDLFGRSLAVNGNHILIGSHKNDSSGTDSGSAYLFDTTTGEQVQKFLAPDSFEYDNFGWSVALDGNYALIGSYLDDDSGTNSGSAYLFDITSGEQLQKFIAPDGSVNDNFGWSVAIDGNHALIGSKWDSDKGAYSGSAYLFDLTTGDLQHKFLAPDGVSRDEFGWSVALKGNYALIGSYLDDDNGTDSGSAYLFDINSGEFVQKFVAPDGASEDYFGYAVALNGDSALIGSYGDDDNGERSGSAYLFDITTGDLQQKFLAPDGASYDWFGYSLALGEDSALISSRLDNDNGDASGSAYLFDITTGELRQKFLASDGAEGDRFGESVALDGDSVLIGSFLDDDNGYSSGSAYLFTKSAPTGEFVTPPPPNPEDNIEVEEPVEPYPLSPKIIAPDGASEDWFGHSVAIDGNSALIGSRLDDDNGSNSGSAYLFDITNGNLQQKFIAPDAASSDLFGFSVALYGDYALISSVLDDDNGNGSGSAYLFDIASGDFVQKFLAPDGASYNKFGWSVALYGNYALIGSIWDEDKGPYSGSAYLFDISSGDLLHKFIAPDGASDDDFGLSVAVNGNYALIGSHKDDDNGSNSGSAYLFDITTGNFLQKFVAPDSVSGDHFGYSVALDGNYALIGSQGDDDNGSYSGSAYLFDMTTGDLQYKLIAPDGAIGDAFGYSVALDGDYALIGSLRDDDNVTDSGSAYLFDITNGNFLKKYLAEDGASGDFFSYSVAISANSVLIGSLWDDVQGNDSGSAYLFAIE